jgi:hypothetical protein
VLVALVVVVVVVALVVVVVALVGRSTCQEPRGEAFAAVPVQSGEGWAPPSAPAASWCAQGGEAHREMHGDVSHLPSSKKVFFPGCARVRHGHRPSSVELQARHLG